jgi:nucleoside-diphosphate-sugar epimerase
MILITGGAGFLAAHLAERLRDERLPVRLFDRGECPAWAPRHGAEYVRGDIRDPDAIGTALEGIDAVVHTAFASPREREEVIRSVNVDGTRALCEQAVARGVRRLVMVSSTIVEKPPRAHPFLPSSPLSRLDRYRISRVEAEQIITAAAGQGLSVAMVRPKTFLGPGRVSAFALLFESIRSGQPILVLGSGQNRYQLLDVRDLAEGIRRLTAGDASGVFHLGAREFGTVREDLQGLVAHARSGSRLVHLSSRPARAAIRAIELAGIEPPSEWHVMSARELDCIVDLARAERELEWRPERSNIQALKEAYDWYIASLLNPTRSRSQPLVPAMHRAFKGITRLFPH